MAASVRASTHVFANTISSRSLPSFPVMVTSQGPAFARGTETSDEYLLNPFIVHFAFQLSSIITLGFVLPSRNSTRFGVPPNKLFSTLTMTGE